MTNKMNSRRGVGDALITSEARRCSARGVLTTLSTLALSTAVLAACGSSDATSEPSSTTTVATTVEAAPAALTSPSTTAAAGEPFRSAFYGFVLTSPDWTGRSATVAWDGTGSPGNGDPTVDVLRGPDGQQAYAFGGPTTATLDEFVASARTANANTRGCPETPSATERITIAGEPAIVDEVDCGVFALSATIVHGGEVYAFFTFDQPGKEDEMRSWFRSMLDAVALED
jgi:hypothetical protein